MDVRRMALKYQIPNREYSVNRVKKLLKLRGRSPKWTLNFRQANISNVDIMQQTCKMIIYTLDAGTHFAHYALSEVEKSKINLNL